MFNSLRQDITYSIRSLSRERSLVIGVVSTLALAVGANAAMFGVVQQLLLAAPSGIENPDRVAHVQIARVSEDGDVYRMSTTSYPTFKNLAAQTKAFSDVAGVRRDSIYMGRDAAATQVASLAVTGGYFSLLGAHPFRGRYLNATDDDGDGAAVVVLSNAFWRRQFSGADVLGQQMVLLGEPFTIVGVAKPGFLGDGVAPVDVMMPLSTSMRSSTSSWRSSDGMNLLNILVRVRGDAAMNAASAIATSALRAAPGAERTDQVKSVELGSVVPGAVARQSPQAKIALWLAGVSLVVLLLATANIATLLLLRAVKRRREIAIRIALGAGPARLAQQLLTESLILSVAGAIVGVLLSRWLSAILRATLLPNLAPSDSFVDSRILIATLGLAIAVGLLAGLVPLIQVAEPRVTADLASGSASDSVRGHAAQRVLVGSQVALCTVLLFGAGLFVSSLRRIESQNLGFSTDKLLLAELTFREALAGPDKDLAYEEAVRRVAALPGVSAATVVDAVPFGFHHVPPISVPGHAKAPGEDYQLPELYGATPEYLALLQVTPVAGRLFNARDDAHAPLVVLVNEAMARTVWPGESAVGKCIRFGYDSNAPPSPAASANLPCREVVGVVRDSRVRSLQPTGREASLMQYYAPFAQLPALPLPGMSAVNAILVGTTGDERQKIGAVARALQSSTAAPAYARVRPYQDLIDPQLRSWRLGATLFSIFGALGLGLASLGVFGVISYLAAGRTKEMGIRLALGETRTNIGRIVVVQALRLVGGGVAAGLAIAIGAAPAVQSLLFQTSSRDVGVAAGTAVVLLGVGILAAVLPAWRLSRLDPIRALRVE
jgi:predicted permease